MYTKKEREYYNVDRERACERLGITKNQYNWLRRKGEELLKVYTDNCNGEYDRKAGILNDGVTAEACYSMDCAEIEGKIKARAKELKLYIYF